MLWVVVGWAAAVVIAAVVLGFCLYELVWKARRLSTDVGRLQELAGRLQGLAEELGEAQQRATLAAAAARAGAPSGRAQGGS